MEACIPSAASGVKKPNPTAKLRRSSESGDSEQRRRAPDYSHRLCQHTYAHLVSAPTSITDNMAPSFEQLDPEQAEYDGEEEVDFSGMSRCH
jgi:hypothetical protein